jgi:phage shock protein C
MLDLQTLVSRRETINMGSIHEALRREGFVRQPEGRMLGGVCAGLGRKMGLDPWPTRLLFILVLLLLPGSQLLVYPILWILMPKAEAWQAPPSSPQPWPAA